MINPRSAGRQGSVTGVYGPGNQPNVFPIPRQGGNSSAFNGLPLTADVDQSTVDRAMDDFVQSLYANDEQGTQDRVAHSENLSNGFSFKEVQDLITASRDKVKCCHFSSDGKLLATGHDKKAVLWCTESYTMKSTLEEHSQWITDVCFCHCMYCASRLATSSIDGTVKIWDTNNPGKSVCTFTGHSSPVISLDFHTTTENIVGSCDNVEVRYWSIDKGSCAAVFKGGSTQLRFQPCFGRLLAIAADNFVYIRDVDTGACEGVYIQGLKSKVCSICWDPSGKYLASVSSDLIKVWRLGSGSERTTVHELTCTGNKFNTCIFHPANPSLLVIGCYKTLELWNMAENKIMKIPAHEELISGLAASKVSGLVASASHDDKCVKIWK